MALQYSSNMLMAALTSVLFKTLVLQEPHADMLTDRARNTSAAWRLAWDGSVFANKQIRDSRGAGWAMSCMTAAGGGEGGSASGTTLKLSAARQHGTWN